MFPTYSSAYFLLLLVCLFHKQVTGKEWAYRTKDKHIDRQTDGEANTKVI